MNPTVTREKTNVFDKQIIIVLYILWLSWHGVRFCHISIFITKIKIKECNINKLLDEFKHSLFEPHREKTGFLPRRKQRRRSASR